MVPYRILVADQSEKMLGLIESIFKKNRPDYHMIATNDARTACIQASSELPDLIILGSCQNDFCWSRVVNFLRRVTKTRNIPILVITPKENIEEAFNCGADDIIVFPFNNIELLSSVRLALFYSESIKKSHLQNELLLKQSEEVKRQNKLLEEQKKDMIDDLTYSRRIQNAIMPTKEKLYALFDDCLLYYKPKRIVSGDFYWVSYKDDVKVIAVADCTGHGISGAFLTIAGTAFLNEIITLSKLNAADILNQLRARMMRLLNQNGLEGEASDGMDISLCVINDKKKTIQYAGANNPIYLVRNNGILQILSPDKMPIGIHKNYSLSFKNVDVPVSKGDMIYMFTDGYPDQFGGLEDQKFRYKRLKNLCVSIHDKPLSEQYVIIEKTMDEWIGHRDQIDDMLIIGIRM
jgi:serine phosphatase RsbU (regulator of sigma subunit)